MKDLAKIETDLDRLVILANAFIIRKWCIDEVPDMAADMLRDLKRKANELSQ